MYDEEIRHTTCSYGKKMHIRLGNNFHSHLETTLKRLHYMGRTDCNQERVYWAVWRHRLWTRPLHADKYT